jgi:hypothetical protein
MEAGKEEQRSVVRFLTAEGVGGREIYRRMSVVYGVATSHSQTDGQTPSVAQSYRRPNSFGQTDTAFSQSHSESESLYD